MNSRGLDPLLPSSRTGIVYVTGGLVHMLPLLMPVRLDFANRFFSANEDLNIIWNRVQDKCCAFPRGCNVSASSVYAFGRTDWRRSLVRKRGLVQRLTRLQTAMCADGGACALNGKAISKMSSKPKLERRQRRRKKLCHLSAQYMFTIAYTFSSVYFWGPSKVGARPGLPSADLNHVAVLDSPCKSCRRRT